MCSGISAHTRTNPREPGCLGPALKRQSQCYISCSVCSSFPTHSAPALLFPFLPLQSYPGRNLDQSFCPALANGGVSSGHHNHQRQSFRPLLRHGPRPRKTSPRAGCGSWSAKLWRLLLHGTNCPASIAPASILRVVLSVCPASPLHCCFLSVVSLRAQYHHDPCI